MARQEKGTRLRGLPARVQLGQFDNASGSYPTKSRFSTDKRFGRGSISFDDTKTIDFSSGVFGYAPGIGLISGSFYTRLSAASDMPVNTTITAFGGPRKSVIDESYLITNNLNQTPLRPFIEDNNYEADGKSSNNPFFATGSSVQNVGDGFDSPLWSKQKIEIDISVAQPTTLNLLKASSPGVGSPNNGGVSYPMAYYNFGSQTWEPIGLGYEINSWTSPLANSARHAVDNLTIGFANSFFPPGNSHVRLQGAGLCTSDFGFPYHPKFHATSSQVLKMSDYIDRPFVLEKAVLTISGTWQVGSVSTVAYNLNSRRTVTSSINTCFLLNQRRNQSFDFYKTLANYGGASSAQKIPLTASVPSERSLAWGAQPTRVSTIRDLVGFSQVYSFALNAYDKLAYDSATQVSSSPGALMPITENDVVLQSTTDSGYYGADWTGKVTFSMSMCAPVAAPYDVQEPLASDVVVSGGFTDAMVVYDSSTNYAYLIIGNDGTRTGLGFLFPNTRGLTGDYIFTPLTKRTSWPTADNLTRAQLIVSNKKHKVNPYIVLPTDELVLGWQIPFSTNPAQLIQSGGEESTFTFHTGSFKMVLYGSYIRGGQEENDTTNQLLTSKAIHEVIE